jgi:hypothetical protein
MQFYSNPEEFAELRVLNVNHREFRHETPVLPPRLEQFYCRDCVFAKFPKLPESLLVLDCFGAEFTRLPKLPAGLKELWISGTQWYDLPSAKLPRGLEVLVWNRGADYCDLDDLPPRLRVLELTGYDHHDPAEDSDQLAGPYISPRLRGPRIWDRPPEGLVYLSLDSRAIVGVRNLPEGLVYFNNQRLEEIPDLPEGLEVAILRNNSDFIRKDLHVRSLPKGLKMLDISRCGVLLDCELPHGLVCFRAHYARDIESIRLPDELEEIDVRFLGLRGKLEVPRGVRILKCSNNRGLTEIVWRGDAPPGLRVFSCHNTGISVVPPLPAVMHSIVVSNCKLVGEWKGNFAHVDQFYCVGNKLTELPDIAEVEKFDCSHNRLSWLPECVRVAQWPMMHGNLLSEGDLSKVGSLGDWQDKMSITEWGHRMKVPSLLELAGIAVVEHGLRDAVEVVELCEYLDGFTRCVGCGRAAPAHRRWDFTGSLISYLRCWRCVEPILAAKRKSEPCKKIDFRERYLGKFTISGAYWIAHPR